MTVDSIHSSLYSAIIKKYCDERLYDILDYLACFLRKEFNKPKRKRIVHTYIKKRHIR